METALQETDLLLKHDVWTPKMRRAVFFFEINSVIFNAECVAFFKLSIGYICNLTLFISCVECIMTHY